MMKTKTIFFFLTLACLITTGCQTVNQGAKELGKPVGKVTNVSQAVSDGAVEGTETEEKNSKDNPFNR